MKKRILLPVITASAVCFWLAGCTTKDIQIQQKSSEEIEQKVIFVKIPPVRDEKKSPEERFWQFQKFLFPHTEIPNPIPKGLPNDDSLLSVKLEEDKSLSINSDKFGSLSEISILEEKLSEFFDIRAEMRVFETGSEKVVKAVLFIAPDSAKYGEVFKVLETVEKSGADPIVLKIGDLPNSRVVNRLDE